MSAAQPETPYCIVQYGHKYGTDAWLVLYEDAERSILNTILENMGDCCNDDEQRTVLALIERGAPFEETIEAYQSASGEWFETVRQNVPRSETSDPAARARERLARMAVEEAEEPTS